ncbi:uncharacterized protein LOC111042144 isoform X2 [Myzus persicae]|uniref:uncharacterized protein LOC111042144 isoform X2 n=1 Tax=Myzus persicae TaxID=13164 RepID=UPI000B937CE2|nr:uncharacterized protein LOC111042144 isoform X2 [Myzus persicae]
MTDEKDILYQSEFVSKYCSHMHKLMFVTTRSEEDNEYYIPADREQRKPLEWCMITVMFEI